jgi:hypothetical protein
MNTSQLQCCIDCDPLLSKHVLGVFAADRLPRMSVQYPRGFIANTDDHVKSGTHWCAFYIPAASSVVEFFDTYGQRPNQYNKHFIEYLSRFSKVVFKDRQLQSDTSNVCGLYCLFYLSQRLQGISFNAFINIFSDYTHENDAFVHRNMTNLYSQCVENSCIYNQTCKPFRKINI